MYLNCYSNIGSLLVLLLLLTGWLLLVCTCMASIFLSAMNDCTDTCAGKVSNLTQYSDSLFINMHYKIKSIQSKLHALFYFGFIYKSIIVHKGIVLNDQQFFSKQTCKYVLNKYITTVQTCSLIILASSLFVFPDPCHPKYFWYMYNAGCLQMKAKVNTYFIIGLSILMNLYKALVKSLKLKTIETTKNHS